MSQYDNRYDMNAAVGVGVSDLGYRKFGFGGFMSSMDPNSSMDSVHGFGPQAWPWQWQEKEKQETVYHEECINTPICTAIALQSIHLVRVSFKSIVFLFRLRTPACTYISSYSRSISNRYRALLALWQRA